METETHVAGYIERIGQVLDEMPLQSIKEVCEVMYDAYLDDQQFFFCGNGGSWATACHAENDFQKGTYIEGKKPMRIVSLANVPAATAYGNDDGYNKIFVNQLRTLLNKGDVVTAISASGNSPNVVEAVEYANEQEATTVAWTAFGGGKLSQLCDHSIVVPCDRPEYGPAEDMHMMLDHLISSYLKERIQKEGPETV